MRVTELAEFLDLTPRRVQQLAAAEIIPKAKRGEYDGPACVVAYIRHLRALSQGKEASTLTGERQRLVRLQADRRELDLEAARGNLVATDWVVDAFGRVFEIFRARALALPAKLAPTMHGAKSIAKAKDILEAGVHELLEALSYPDAAVLRRYVGRAKGTKKTPRARHRRGGNGTAATAVDRQ